MNKIDKFEIKIRCPQHGLLKPPYHFRDCDQIKHVAFAHCPLCNTEYTSEIAIERAKALNDYWKNSNQLPIKKRKIIHLSKKPNHPLKAGTNILYQNRPFSKENNNVTVEKNTPVSYIHEIQEKVENISSTLHIQDSKADEYTTEKSIITSNLKQHLDLYVRNTPFDSLIGARLKHFRFGEGIVISIEEEFFIIRFLKTKEDNEKKFGFQALFDYFIPQNQIAKEFFYNQYDKCTKCGNYCKKGEKFCNSCQRILQEKQDAQMKCHLCKNVQSSKFNRHYYADKYCICKSCVDLAENTLLDDLLKQQKSKFDGKFCLLSKNEMADLYIKLNTDMCSDSIKYEEEKIRWVVNAIEENCPAVISEVSNRYRINVTDDNKTLYIHTGNQIKCKQKRHPIISATGVVLADVQTEQHVDININYCLSCQKCFISNSEYERMRKEFGVLYVKFNWIDKNGNEWTDTNGLAGHSPLSLTGYSVDTRSGYNSEIRHTILKRIIVNGILSKTKVIDYLNWFIKFNGASPNMMDAVLKWKDDLDFVRNYNLEKQSRIRITAVKKW